jgi:hypothetical protein
MNKTVGDVIKEIKSMNTKGAYGKSVIIQIVLGLGVIYSCLFFSSQMQYYYSTLTGRMLMIIIISIGCGYKYTLFVSIFIICIFLNSFKTYEGFSFTDVDSITAGIKNNLPASVVSLPANPTPQNIYDYLNKQVCTPENSVIYKQITSSTSSSDDAKLLSQTGSGMNTLICSSGEMFYQKPQELFDAFKSACASNPKLDEAGKKRAEKITALTSSISADSTSSNVFSAPLIAIAKWYSTANSAICGATATPATTTETAKKS